MNDEALKRYIKEAGLSTKLYHQVTVHWSKWCFQEEKWCFEETKVRM